MTSLEDIQPNAAVRGILPDALITSDVFVRRLADIRARHERKGTFIARIKNLVPANKAA
jgi:hypothetical protein